MEEMNVAVERKRKHPRRWMPGKRQQKLQAAAGEMVRMAGRILPSFLLAFADMLGIPSGLHGAYMAAMAAAGESLFYPACGCGLAVLMRLVWGLPLRLESIAMVGILLMAPVVIFGRGMPALMGWTALSLLPGVIWQLISGTAADALTACAGLVIAVVSAPVMLRALRVLKGDSPIATMEERVSVGYLAGMLLCGGGRMMLFMLNAGALGGAAVTLAAALFLGVGPGTMIGLMAGLMLALQGLPLGLPVALALGGFLAGMIQCLRRRWLTCLCFALGSGLAVLLMGASGYGCGMAGIVAAGIFAFMPRSGLEQVQQLSRRFIAADPPAGDGYAAASLAQWEKTVAAMARAVPSPVQEDGPRSASWWKCRLCEGCPDDAQCTSMLTDLARHSAETVWAARQQDEDAWGLTLENLRGLGCGRLYFLRERMDLLRREERQQEKAAVRLQHQRDMLVTHLTAMAGAARRFALLSSGESWWEDISARQLRRVLAETALPATLVYARRVQGHARVCLECHRGFRAEDQAEHIAGLCTRTLALPMEVERIDGDRVTLAERPLWQVQYGAASEGLNGSEICGDTVLCTMLQDGRFLAAMSDGMGHGQQAQRESKQTMELLRLCLEAGYTRQQTLTAVNGMMLLCSRGERFSTVDMALFDLWTGQLTLDKLGAASSWLVRGRELTELGCDALPLGILEEVDSHGRTLRLREGDQLFLMTDGVEDAFPCREELKEAVLSAADEAEPQAAAQALLASACAQKEQAAHDDRSAAVIRFTKL